MAAIEEFPVIEEFPLIEETPVAPVGIDLVQGKEFPYGEPSEELMRLQTDFEGRTIPESGFLRSAAGAIASGALHTAAGAAGGPGRAADPQKQREYDELQGQLDSLNEAVSVGNLTDAEFRDATARVRYAMQQLEGEAAQLPAQLRGAAEQAYEFYGADPRSTNPAAQVGRAAGTVFEMLPTMIGTGGAGIPLAAVQATSHAHSQAYAAKEAELRASGETDEAKIMQEANDAGRQAAAKATVTLPAYLLAGKGAAVGVGKLLGESAGTATRVAAQTAGATTANLGTSATMRAIEGENPWPTLEQATVDVLWGIVHGVGEYRNSGRVAIQRALGEIERRAKAEETTAETPPAESVITTPPTAVEAPPKESAKPPLQEIVPVIKIGGERVPGRPGDTHDEIFNRFFEGKDPDEKLLARADFDAPKRNPNYFEDANGNPISREQLKEWYGVSSSQELRALQIAEAKKAAVKAEPPKPPTDEERVAKFISAGMTEAEALAASAKVKELEPLSPAPKTGTAPPPTSTGEPAARGGVGGPTSIRNAQVDQERAQMGLPPVAQPLRRTFGTVWDEATRIATNDRPQQDQLIAELTEKPRAVTDTEDALLLHRKVEIQSQLQRAANELNAAAESGAPTEAAQTRFDFLADEFVKITDLTKRVGTESGRGLAARKILINSDYTLAPMIARARAAKGGAKLTPEETATISKQAEEIQRTEQQFEERVSNVQADAAVDEMIRSAQEVPPKVKPLVERIVKYLDDRSAKARTRLRERLSKLGSAPDPLILADVADIAASAIAKGTVKFADWSVQMAKDFGERIRPYLQAGWDRADSKIDEAVGSLAPKKDRGAATKAVKKSGPTVESLDAALGAQAKDGDSFENLGRFVRKLAESFVRGGVTEREALVDAVHGVVTKHFPDVSRRETMDAISGYGDFRPLDKDPVKTTLRDLKGQLQNVAKLEDIQAREPLQKTGVERRTPSDEERRLIREVNEAKKKYGVTQTDPETQLKGALDAAKTRLRNQIRDLAYEIETGETTPGREPLMLDAEAEGLRGLRDRLRQTLRDIEGPKTQTDEQRLKAAQRSLEDSISVYEKRIADRELTRPKGKAPESPALDALRARRDALKAELDEMRSNDSVLTEERKAEALVRSIGRAENELAGAAKPKRGAQQGPDTELVAEAKKELAGLRDQLRARRQTSPEEIAKRQERAEATLERSIADLDQRIQNEDLGARKLNVTPEGPRMERLRAERDALRRMLNEMRAAGRPKLSREEISLKSLKTRLARESAELQERLAAGDFEKPARNKVDISKDPEAVRLKAENARIKEEFEKAAASSQWERLSRGQKAAVLAKESLHIPRTVLSSFDFSALGRQAGWTAAGNPRMAARAAKEMFEGAFSEKSAREAYERLKLRPNAPLYERSGLYLADIAETRVTKMEEAIMSRYAEKIPGIRISNRAYITALNRIRADHFDALKASLERKGAPMSQQELEAIANYVNAATGRGNLGSAGKAAETLAAIFFSPRLLASRFQLALMPFTGFRSGGPTSGRVRRAIAKEYAKSLSGFGVIAGLGALAGATIETDPRSSDFGKLRFGDTRIDPLAGLAQVTTFLSRAITGETKNTSTGEVEALRSSLRPRTWFTGEIPDDPNFFNKNRNLPLDFMRGKFAPITATITDLITGENVVGEPVTPADIPKQLLVPLSMRDVADVMEEQGVPKGTALYILSLFGWGLQNYKKD